MLRCHEVSQLVASDTIARAGLFRRAELRMHLLMCRHCRNYAHQIARIGAAARSLWGGSALDAEEVAAMEARVLGVLRQGGGPEHPHAH